VHTRSIECTHLTSCSMNDVDNEVDEMHVTGETPAIAAQDVSSPSTITADQSSSATPSSVNAYVLFAVVILFQLGGFLVVCVRSRIVTGQFKTLQSTIMSTTNSLQQRLDDVANSTHFTSFNKPDNYKGLTSTESRSSASVVSSTSLISSI
jgi:hypothetical protein